MMQGKLVDHLFRQIVEGRQHKDCSASAIKAKLEQVDQMSEQLSRSFSNDVREKVLGYSEVKFALEQCLDYVENDESALSEQDFSSYYRLVAARLSKADQIIANELKVHESS